MVAMPSKQLPLYATPNELAVLLKDVNSIRPLELSVMELLDKAEPVLLADSGDLRPFTRYLVFDRGLIIAARSIPQRSGAVKYAIDQLENPYTVVLSCGGFIDDQRLIASQIGTAATDRQSEELYTMLAKAIRRTFEKVKGYYVGPEASKLLDRRGRLSPTANSPESYDLAR